MVSKLSSRGCPQGGGRAGSAHPKLIIISGINPVLLDEKGQVVEGKDANGALCLATPWPGIARTLFGDHDRYTI